MNKPAVVPTAQLSSSSAPKHIAIIMDGNRRWAKSRRLPAIAGHRRGLRQLLELVPHFGNSGVEVLSLFGFSSANWQRDKAEVDSLMRLADQAIRRFIPICVRENIQVKVIGRRDRLPTKLVADIEAAEEATKNGLQLLRVAIDYSSREAILDAARNTTNECTLANFSEQLSGTIEVDLLIRTGKEQRLSDFLLWECAFAELYFPDLYWPDFSIDSLESAVSWYQQRSRRFGG